MTDEYQRFTPSNIPDLPTVANEYFRQIGQMFDRIRGRFTFEELHEEPARRYDGLTVMADGTDWNPGSGQGVYAFYNSTWNKLG